MARRLKSLLPGSAVDGHGGGLGSLGQNSLAQVDDQSVKQDLPADQPGTTPGGAPDEGAAGDGGRHASGYTVSSYTVSNRTASLGFSRNLANGNGAGEDRGADGRAVAGAGGNGAGGNGAGGSSASENSASENSASRSSAGGGRGSRGGLHAARGGGSRGDRNAAPEAASGRAGNSAGHGADQGADEGAGGGEGPEAAPTATLERPAKERRRRWLSGPPRDVPAANALCDLTLLVRVRDRLKELPDSELAQAELQQAGAAGDGASGDGGDSDQAITAIRDTFAIVGAAGDMAPAYFYGWLFANHPELRELFPPAMDEQRDRLFSALTQIVESLRTPQEMAVYLAQLGRDHRKYAVRPDMYQAVGAALIATLRAFAGPAFTQAAEDAWVSTYGVASDIMINAAEEAGASTPAFWHAEVVDHERRGHDVAIITVAPEERFSYRAGQHVTVQTSRWPRVWRPYSIACRAREDGLLRFHVKAVSGGWVSSSLVHHTSVGDPLILGPAVGNMTLAPAERRDLLCVAGGTGLAPIKAIVEQVVYEEATQRNHRNIWLFWGVRTEKDMYDLKDLWRLTDIYPWLLVHPVTSDDPSYPGMQGNVGRVAARYLPHGDCEAYVAGPAAMVRETIRVLTKTGLPIDRVHYDDGLIGGRRRVGTGT